MKERERFLATVPALASVTPDGISTVAALLTEVSWGTGETVFSVGDAGDSMYVVVEGAVEVFALAGDVEKLFMTARAGAALGMLELIDGGVRSGTARALEPTTALALGSAALDRLRAEHPAVAAALLTGMGVVIGRRVRVLVEQYTAALAWNLEVTNLTSFNLERLMSERIRVVVERVRGEPLRGTLFRLEESAAGHELYVATDDREIVVIPYHAIVSLRVQRDDASLSGDEPIS